MLVIFHLKPESPQGEKHCEKNNKKLYRNMNCSYNRLGKNEAGRRSVS